MVGVEVGVEMPVRVEPPTSTGPHQMLGKHRLKGRTPAPEVLIIKSAGPLV